MLFKNIYFVMILIFSLVSTSYGSYGQGNIKNIALNYECLQEIEIEIIEEQVIIDMDNTEENPEENLEENLEEKPEENLEGNPGETIDPNIEQVIEIIKFNPDGLLLNYGVANEEVLRIKSFLRLKGYTVPEGYFYDNETKQMIADYQFKNGLVSDGIIGKYTYNKINEDMEINKIVIPKWKLDENIILPKEVLIINKSSNTLYHIKDNKIVERYAVATGKEVEYTPEGKFTIVNKYVNPYWGGAGINKPIKGGAANNPLGKRWMGLNLKGGGTYGIHGNSNEKSIGKYVSLGCIRMHNAEVEYLFEIVPLGTEVWIGRQELINTFLSNINLD